MLYIPLDSEFEGLSYEGTLFFSYFCEKICSHLILGKVCRINFFFIELIFMLYILLDSEFEELSYEGTVGLRI